jgi:hypothetical protein
MTTVSLALMTVAAAHLAAASQPRPAHRTADTLTVPYIAQPVHLCGGAAMAMVERFWGRRGVYASDFAHLVRKDLAGIVTTDLENAARARGWNPRLVYGVQTVRDVLQNGIPVIALIEVAPGRKHYVVLLSWSEEAVVYHDPAIAPSRSQPTARFLAQWDKTDRWAMTVLPAEASSDPTSQLGSDAAPVSGTVPPPPAGLCHRTIRHAHQLLEAGREESAASLLESMLGPCADTTHIRRALAGLRFRQQRWSAAARLADAHVGDHPDDRYAWSLLGASRFLAGNPDGALDAWNTIGEPRVDLVSIQGLKDTHFRAIADALGLQAGDTLDMAALEHARRRLGEVPSISASRIRYRPVGGGLVEVRAQVLEHEWSGGSLWVIGETVTRSLVWEEVHVDLISPTGGGERLSAAWTWPAPRRRLRLALDVPAPLGLLGTLHLSGQLARETFAPGAITAPEVEERRTAEVAYADWLSPHIRVRMGGGVDRWKSIGDYGVARMSVSVHPRGDRVAVVARTALWASPNGARAFARFGVRADWRTGMDPTGTLLTARAGLDHVSSGSPRMEWPSAGIRREGSAVLRAHRLLRDDTVAGSTIGRTLLHGGVTADRWLTQLGFLRVGAGIFADAAAVWDGDLPQDSPYRLDVGTGIRLGSGFGSSVLRVDVAQALLDAGRAVSVSLSTPWPS